MKNISSSRVLGVLLLTGLINGGSLRADDKTINNPEMSPIIREEFRRAREELKTQLGDAKKRIADLEVARQKIIAHYKKLGAQEKVWIEHLRKYDLLIVARNSDEKADYVPVKEVAVRDVDNLNKLFDEYVQMRPFSGRITAEQTRKFIEEGRDKLAYLSKMHLEPVEKNTPDLAIVAREKVDAEKEVRRVTILAAQLGFDLNKDIQYADIPMKRGDRAPASAPAAKQ